jgi:WD40 repeat protein
MGKREPMLAVVSTNMMAKGGERFTGQMTDARVAGSGEFVAAANGTNKIQLMSLIGKPAQQLVASEGALRRLSIHPRSTYLAAVGPATDASKSQLLIWETVDLKQVASLELAGVAKSIDYSRDGALIVIAFEDNHIEVIESSSAKKLESTPPIEGLRRVAFSQDGSRLYIARQGGAVTIQPLLVMGQATAGSSAIVSLSFHGGGKFILSAAMDGAMTLWSRANFSAPQAVFQGLQSPIQQSKVSTDGRFVLAVYEDAENSTYIWDLQSGASSATKIEPKLVIRSSAGGSSAAFTSDGRYLLIGGKDGAIRAWSLEEGREVARFTGHEGPVMDIAPQVDAGHFVSGGIDHSIRSWRFPDSLPPPGAEIPQGALADATAVRDLAPPDVSKVLAKEDPNADARQALIAGRGTADILDLMEGDSTAKQDAKQLLEVVRKIESSGIDADPQQLSRQRRQLASIQRRMAPADESSTLSTFAAGFSNLTFAADTNFQFIDDRQFRPVKLLLSDRFVYAARPSSGVSTKRVDENGKEIDEGDNGALLSWDYRYSRLQAHAWSIDNLNVQALYPLPSAAGVFTVPQMMIFSQDGSSRQLTQVASWASSNQPHPARQLLAVGTQGAGRTESDILKIFDVADFANEQVSPFSQYRGYESVVTAMAFANHSPLIAFCVRERAVHRLFIADAATLTLKGIEEVGHNRPWLKLNGEEGFTRADDVALGITSLVFSPDDEFLIAHGNYGQDTYKFVRWKLKWDENKQLASIEKTSKDVESKDGPLFLDDGGSRSIWFVSKSAQEGGESSGSKRILVRVAEGFVLINLNTLRAERRILFPMTQHGWPEYSITEDGRWLISGQDNGMAYIWDTLKGTRYNVTIDTETETLIAETKSRLTEVRERPAHSGPIVGVALSQPDPGQDYPAFAATIGEENKIKVWELFPILDPITGLRAKK